jgi:ubiquinone/menaquinone biosynthesis C-methylase UbiE
MGTDHLSMAREGGILHGIDLTPRNLEVTRTRLGIYGFDSELSVGDAENLPYKDDSFDFVYSFGVVHHSPDTRKIVSEIHRILVPGGRCHVTVYHRNSVFFWWTVYAGNYLLRGGWRKRTLEQQLSLIEYPNTNQDMVIRLYRKSEFADLFRGFRRVRCSVRHLIPVDMAVFSRCFTDPFRPSPLLDRIGRSFGWYVVVDAEK